MRVSNPRATPHLNLEMPFKSSKLKGMGPSRQKPQKVLRTGGWAGIRVPCMHARMRARLPACMSVCAIVQSGAARGEGAESDATR